MTGVDGGLRGNGGQERVWTVAGLARAAGVAPHVVRYYARAGLLHPARRSGNGYRMFGARDLACLKFIRKAKQLGYTLGEIREILDEARQGRSPCPRVRQILQRRVEETRQQLEGLQRLQARMEEALDLWSALPDGVPDGDTVCHLIEAAVEEEEAGSPGGRRGLPGAGRVGAPAGSGPEGPDEAP